MKTLDFWKSIEDSNIDDNHVCLIIIAHSEGFTPGKTGFKMAVSQKGEITGTIGGGSVENELKQNALKYIAEGISKPLIVNYSYDNVIVDEEQMICGGKQTFIVFPIGQKHKQTISHFISSFKVPSKSALVFHSNGDLTFGKTNNEQATDKYKFDFFSEEDWVFSEAYGDKPIIHIIGGGHVSLSLSRILSTLDYYIKVYDERKEPETMKLNVYADEKHCVPFYKVHTLIKPDANSFIVIMTPDHKSDEIVLRNTILLDVKYIGMMASPQKSKLIKQHLIESGFEEEKINKLHSPIGISINSNTPEEIAISIAAEIISVNNGDL